MGGYVSLRSTSQYAANVTTTIDNARCGATPQFPVSMDIDLASLVTGKHERPWGDVEHQHREYIHT
jgi:hypothetical protein